jgi:hypothetical protein
MCTSYLIHLLTLYEVLGAVKTAKNYATCTVGGIQAFFSIADFSSLISDLPSPKNGPTKLLALSALPKLYLSASSSIADFSC